MVTEITCLCDNNVKLSTSLRGEHGISFYIERYEKTILFDTGQTYEVLSHNAKVLEKDLDKAKTVILSHGHYDHTGGLKGIISSTHRTIIAHPDIFEKKYKVSPKGDKVEIGIPFSRKEIEENADIYFSKGPHTIVNGIYSTGEIPRFEASEKVPLLFAKEKDGEVIHDDILDDQSLIIEGENGAIILLGCNHSGIINTIEYCKTLTNQPIKIVAGGTHLVAATKERMKTTIDYIKKQDIKLIGFHCTGDKASAILASELDSLYQRGHVGMNLII